MQLDRREFLQLSTLTVIPLLWYKKRGKIVPVKARLKQQNWLRLSGGLPAGLVSTQYYRGM